MKLRFWKNIDKQEVEKVFNPNEIAIDDFQMMLKFGKASDTIGKWKSKPFIELSYGIVKKHLPALQKQNLINETIELIMDSQFPDFKIENASGNEIISFLLWINSQQEFLYKIESENLQSEPEPEILAAGLHRLNDFGIAPTVEKIAKDWNYKPEEVEQTPYFKIYEKIKLDKIQGEINKAYQKIIEEKAKRKR